MNIQYVAARSIPSASAILIAGYIAAASGDAWVWVTFLATGALLAPWRLKEPKDARISPYSASLLGGADAAVWRANLNIGPPWNG